MLEHEVAKYNNYLGPQPDVCLIWRVRQSLKFRYFVEYETGSHRPTMAAAKLRHYGWYAGTEECQATWERIPCILFVVPDLGYETQLARAVLLELRQLQTRVPVLMTHQGLLERHRLLDPIWRAGGMHAVSADGRATCWGKENNELLLHEKSEDYLARASRKNLL
jgi:predicted amidohydrolase